jgi:hypothetical protein
MGGWRKQGEMIGNPIALMPPMAKGKIFLEL